MKQKVKLSNDVIIEIENNPLASGGEADIYEILTPSNYSQQVLKIYKVEKRTKLKEDKLNYLIGNKPNLNDVNGHHSVIWPIHMAFISNKFVGYTMPKASGIKLELLCHPKLPKNLHKEWDKFSFKTPGSKEARLKLCFNISAALSQIHSFGSYVLVDMKPDNVMVKPDGLISIIDIDSTEIIKNNLLLFPAHVATPEYTPPEYYSSIKNIETHVINETWDRFSIAIIFYRLLFGIHPFTGSLNYPFETLSNVSDLIQKGFLPIGKNKDRFKVIPPPHIGFQTIDNQIQQLFINALEISNINAYLRPTPDDWCKILSPNPGIQINRKTPTGSINCFIAVYTIKNILKSIPEITIKKPVYLSKVNNTDILTKFIQIFIKSEKEKLYQLILSKQKKADSELKNIENIKIQFKKEKNRFEVELADILKREKINIDQLINTHRLNASNIDLKAQELFIKEAEKYNLFQKNYLKDLSFLEFKVKEEYEITIRNAENIFNNQKDILNKELSNLYDNENNQIKQLDLVLKKNSEEIKSEIQKLENGLKDKIDNDSKFKLQAIEQKRGLLKDKEKKLIIEALEKYQSTFSNNNLTQHKISDDKYSIFTDSYAEPDKIVANLSRNGIVTAADIKGVDELGRILKSNGSWVKVNDVAYVRAKSLERWRQKIERMNPSSPPQSLPYTTEYAIKQSLLHDVQNFDSEEKNIRQEIINKKNEIVTQLSNHLNEAKKQEQILTNSIQNKKNLIAAKFKIDREKIQRSINELVASYSLTKINQLKLFDKNTQPYKEKIENLNILKDKTYLQIIEEFDPLHIKLIEEVKQLDYLFRNERIIINNATLCEMNDLNLRYESVYNNYIEKMKDIINAFNITVNSLIGDQTQYKQMK